MRSHRSGDDDDLEAARREPLLGAAGGSGAGGSGGEEAGTASRGVSPNRNLSPDRVLSSTPGGAFRLTKRASTAAQVRRRVVPAVGSRTCAEHFSYRHA